MNTEQWYVATMNDCVLIVDREPRPAPVDYVNQNLPEPSVVISMRSGSREAQEIAAQIVAAHNAPLQRLTSPPAQIKHTSPSYIFREGEPLAAYQIFRSDESVGFIHEACAASIYEREFPVYVDEFPVTDVNQAIICETCDRLILEVSGSWAKHEEMMAALRTWKSARDKYYSDPTVTNQAYGEASENLALLVGVAWDEYVGDTQRSSDDDGE